MKKILFIICALSLMLCLTIPCSAEEITTYNYNGYELYDLTYLASDSLPDENGHVSLGSYCWILHNPTTDVFYFYFGNADLVYDTELNSLSFGRQGSYEIVQLTKDDVIILNVVESVNENSTLGSDSSYLLWSSHTVRYRDNKTSPVNNQVYMQGDLNVQPNSFTYADSLRLDVGNTGSSTVVNDTVPYVLNAVNVLLVVGVSCLAIFVVFKLFGRRTLLFK